MINFTNCFLNKFDVTKLLKSIVLLLILKPQEINSITSPTNTLNQSLIYPKIEDSNLILGALFPVHEQHDRNLTSSCGKLQGVDGILPLEALLFSLDKVNEDENLLPNITLGILVLDSCNSPDIALQQSLRFIKGFIANQNTHHETEFLCKDNSTPVYKEGNYDKVVGVIGGQYSSVSIQMANVLKLFKVPQISYRSTSASLSQKDRYPYFLRTVPTDNNQAEVILKVLEYYKISYASLVYSKTEYGIGGQKELKSKSKNSSVCFADPEHGLEKSDPDSVYEGVVTALVKRKKAKVIVLFADLKVAARLFRAMKKNGAKFIWIGSDGWTAPTNALDDFTDVIQGSIGIQPLARSLPGFDEYFNSRTPENNLRNPWFKEYWQDHFNCNLKTDLNCAKKSLKNSNKFVEVQWLHFVRDSVYAFAHGLNDMRLKHCKGKQGLCEEMAHNGHVHGQDLYDSLRQVDFLDVMNRSFKFQESGSSSPRYTVFTFNNNSKRNPWVAIANFPSSNGSQELEFLDPELVDDSAVPRNSYCGMECGPRQEKIVEPDACCWECKNCSSNQYLNTTTTTPKCISCNVCQIPNALGSACVNKTDKYLDYRNQWAITAMAFASLGVFSTIFVGIIFWVHLDTPVIRAASRELSYILLAGILMSFCTTFAILAPPSPLSCGFTRFFLGFSYTLCYSAILTKTNRISRIFNQDPSKSRVKTRYTSPRSQMVIVLLLVCVEVIINVIWLMYYKPDVKQLCQKEELTSNILICKGINDISYIIGFIYPLFLVCLCTIYAIKTRKCPGGFNEARYIAFTNYTTCIIWLVFVPLYLTTPPKDGVRIVSLAMSLSLGGFVQLGCLFFPKVHVVLFKPEKNTRDAVMSQPKGSAIGRDGYINSIARSHTPQSGPAMVYINGTSTSYPSSVGRNSSRQSQIGDPQESLSSQQKGNDLNLVYLSPTAKEDLRQ